MEILRPNFAGIKRASTIVKLGGLIVYPTDTVYGLGCDPMNSEAVKELIAVKGDRDKPLPVLGSSLGALRKVVKLESLAMRLIDELWPGPLTIVATTKVAFPRLVTLRTNTLGVRIPAHAIALELIRSCGGLLIGTSANKSGHRSCISAREVLAQLDDRRVDAIIDAGPSQSRAPSTVVSVMRGHLTFIRQGRISSREIHRAISGLGPPALNQ